jgi:hypothetical protein
MTFGMTFLVPLFSGVLLVFSRIFLYWLMGVSRLIVLICISPLFIGGVMLHIRSVNQQRCSPVFVVVGVVRVPAK